MPAKFIVILMVIVLIVLFIMSKKFRAKEIENEKKEALDFEALQNQADKKDL